MGEYTMSTNLIIHAKCIMSRETHWMVFCPERGPASVKHTREVDAKEEAERICRKESKTVFIFKCECIGSYEPPKQPDPEWTPMKGTP